MFISSAKNNGDCFFYAFITAFFNKSNSISILNVEEWNEFNHFICDLVSSDKTMLDGNRHNNWRVHTIGSILLKEMHTGMDNTCLMFSYLDLHILSINGKFIPKSEPFVIGNYWVTIINSNHEALHHAVMTDISQTIFTQLVALISKVLKN